jgi:uncharacterized membrane protein
MNKMVNKYPWLYLVVVLAVGILASFGLFAYSVVTSRAFSYSYLVLNVGLATIPLLLSWRIIVLLRKKRWSDWEPLIMTLIWIIFLPNSFYMISDFIHLQNMSKQVILYNSVMFFSFIYLAVLMGLISLYQIHQQLRKRVYPKTAAVLVTILLIGCCFAIYLGRDLRWNSWDVVVNPAGLLFDISNLILKPETYSGMIKTMVSFFVVISSAYLIAWQAARLIWHQGVSDMATHIQRRQK